MNEKIGSFILQNSTEKLNISYSKEKKFYFDFSVAIIKVVIIIYIVWYFKFFENIESLSDLIFPAIFSSMLIFPLSNIFGLTWKPKSNFLSYHKKSKSLTVRNNYFVAKKILIEETDYIRVKKNKEKLKYDGTIIYAYNYVVYYIKKNENKTELFVVNPSGILRDYEDNILNELERTTKKILTKIRHESGLRIIHENLKES